MRRTTLPLFVLGLLLTSCVEAPPPAPPSTMTIESPAFQNGGRIPVRYTCDGEGVSPPLTFAGVPGGAQSLVLIMSDPDAPGGDFVHWVVYDIDPTVTEIPEGTVPKGGSLGISSAGQRYVPPCPPSGVHRYVFRLYAIDRLVLFETTPNKQDLLAAIDPVLVAEAELMGRYGR